MIEQQTTAPVPPKTLDQLFADWLTEHNATIVVVAVAPVTGERIGIINIMDPKWPIAVRIVPNQEQAQ